MGEFTRGRKTPTLLNKVSGNTHAGTAAAHIVGVRSHRAHQSSVYQRKHSLSDLLSEVTQKSPGRHLQVTAHSYQIVSNGQIFSNAAVTFRVGNHRMHIVRQQQLHQLACTQRDYRIWQLQQHSLVQTLARKQWQLTRAKQQGYMLVEAHLRCRVSEYCAMPRGNRRPKMRQTVLDQRPRIVKMPAKHVRRSDDALNTVGGQGLDQCQRLRLVTRPIVNAWQEVGVDVDHALADARYR